MFVSVGVPKTLTLAEEKPQLNQMRLDCLGD